jgi:hypothetical protein
MDSDKEKLLVEICEIVKDEKTRYNSFISLSSRINNRIAALPFFASPSPADATDEEIDADLRAAGIDMEPANARLREIIDQHGRNSPPRVDAPPPKPAEYCDRCDGCGWYEGGKAIQTDCEKCNGTGVVQAGSYPDELRGRGVASETIDKKPAHICSAPSPAQAVGGEYEWPDKPGVWMRRGVVYGVRVFQEDIVVREACGDSYEASHWWRCNDAVRGHWLPCDVTPRSAPEAEEPTAPKEEQ